LKELDLRGNGLDDHAMQAFADVRAEPQLDALDLGENWLGGSGVAYLAKAPCLRELKVLELDSCEMGLAAARQLAKAPFLDSLRQLYLSSNRFGPAALRTLLEKKPRRLHALLIGGNKLPVRGVSHLAASPASNTLLDVNLVANDMGDAGARALAKSKYLRNLLFLRVHFNRISASAAVALTQSRLGKQLAVLDGVFDQ
jgi:Ran GTPase-activating protein (RanGAP) involved in mRNA processing and transport